MSAEPLIDRLLGPAGPVQRRALAKAITLLESTRADHRAQADDCDGLAPDLGVSAHGDGRHFNVCHLRKLAR